MDQAWINRLLGEVRSRMKMFEVDGCRQSRRIEGIYDRPDEVHGFKRLIIYIDAGLTGKEDVIGKILGQIDGYIYSQYHHNHIRYLSFFGVESDKLTGPRPARGHSGITSSTWRGIIAQHLLVTPPVDSVFIPRLHNAGSSNTRLPEKKDLVLFFCRDKNVSTTADTQKRLGFIKGNCIWFFFDGGELPVWEAGKFV